MFDTVDITEEMVAASVSSAITSLSEKPHLAAVRTELVGLLKAVNLDAVLTFYQAVFQDLHELYNTSSGQVMDNVPQRLTAWEASASCAHATAALQAAFAAVGGAGMTKARALPLPASQPSVCVRSQLVILEFNPAPGGGGGKGNGETGERGELACNQRSAAVFPLRDFSSVSCRGFGPLRASPQAAYRTPCVFQEQYAY